MERNQKEVELNVEAAKRRWEREKAQLNDDLPVARLKTDLVREMELNEE